MSAAFWLPMLTKAAATALLVVAASALAEAVGPFWGALIGSLPISAGPAYVFLAMQHDAGFVAASALSSLAGNAATGLFLIVYALRAGRMRLWPGMGLALATWLVASQVTRSIGWSPVTAVLANLMVYGAGFVLVRRVAQAPLEVRAPLKRRWFELPARGGAVAVFVSAVVLGSSVLGPAATGTAAVFPLGFISLLVIVHARMGGGAASRLAAAALQGMLGFGLVLLVLHWSIPAWGVAAALGMALSVSVAWAGGLLVFRRWTA
jgi:hypothetical protein